MEGLAVAGGSFPPAFTCKFTSLQPQWSPGNHCLIREIDFILGPRAFTCRALSSSAGARVLVLHHGPAPQLLCKCQRRRDGSGQSSCLQTGPAEARRRPGGGTPVHAGTSDAGETSRGCSNLLTEAGDAQVCSARLLLSTQVWVGCGRSAAAPHLTPPHEAQKTSGPRGCEPGA